jgi:sarcosine oxidase
MATVFDADVAVIGLGTMGSLTSWRLAAAGLKVLGFEQHGFAHDRGAAGGDTRRIATHSMGDAREVRLVQESITLWRTLEAETSTALLNLNGGLVIGPPDAPGLVNARNSARSLDLPQQYFAAGSAQGRYPQHYIGAQHDVLFDPNAGYIRAQPAVLAALTAARHRGASLHDRAKVIKFDSDTDGVTLQLDGGQVRVRRTVVAAGPWLSELLPAYATKVQIRRVLQAWFLPHDIALFHPDVFPVYQRTGDTRIYGFPTIDGATIKMGIVAPVPEVLQSASDLHQQIVPEQTDFFRKLVARYFPQVHPEPARISAYVEGYTKGMQGLFGPIASMPNVIAMGGFSGTGFKFAPVFAEIAAQIAGAGSTSRNVDFLSPDRPLEDWET